MGATLPREVRGDASQVATVMGLTADEVILATIHHPDLSPSELSAVDRFRGLIEASVTLADNAFAVIPQQRLMNAAVMHSMDRLEIRLSGPTVRETSRALLEAIDNMVAGKATEAELGVVSGCANNLSSVTLTTMRHLANDRGDRWTKEASDSSWSASPRRKSD